MPSGALAAKSIVQWILELCEVALGFPAFSGPMQLAAPDGDRNRAGPCKARRCGSAARAGLTWEGQPNG